MTALWSLDIAWAGQSPPREEGWTRHQEKCREASPDGADGVVACEPCVAKHSATFGDIDHPVCAAAEASRHFVNGAATPPHEEGTASTSHFVRTVTCTAKRKSRPNDPRLRLCLRVRIRRKCPNSSGRS